MAVGIGHAEYNATAAEYRCTGHGHAIAVINDTDTSGKCAHGNYYKANQ